MAPSFDNVDRLLKKWRVEPEDVEDCFWIAIAALVAADLDRSWAMQDARFDDWYAFWVLGYQGIDTVISKATVYDNDAAAQSAKTSVNLK